MGCLKTHIEWEPNLRLVYSKKEIKPLKKRINYYPFGLDHNYGLNAPMSIVSGRDHKYAYNGKEQMKDLGVNVTEMTFRQYDNALGRFHGVDKLSAMTPSVTPYNFALNNPIYFSDPTGLKASASDNSWFWDNLFSQIDAFFAEDDGPDSWELYNVNGNAGGGGSAWNPYSDSAGGGSSFNFNGSGTYSGGAMTSSATGWGYGNGSSNNQFNNFIANINSNSTNKPYNDITVNSKGVVTNVDFNNQQHRVFDENGNQLQVNDSNFDSQWLGMVREDDVLYKTVGTVEILSDVNKSTRNIRHSSPLVKYLFTAIDSHSDADFGYNTLRPRHKMYNTEYDGYKDGNGAFFRVQGQNTLYNLPDLGQFMWGVWMRANGYSLFETKSGAHINNLIFGSGLSDSKADQSAIISGYNWLSNLLK